MNAKRIERFLSNLACMAAGADTPLFARDFLYRLPKFPTPRLKLMPDGAIRMRWRRGGREVKVYVRGGDVNFSLHSERPGDAVPAAVVEARTVQRAMAMGLRWMAKAAKN